MLTVLDRPATDSIVSLEIMKQHLRVDHNDEDTIIRLYRDAAIAFLEQHTTLVGAPTLFQETFDSWDCFGESSSLSRAPVRDVVEVSYLDDDDMSVIIDESNYYVIQSPEGAKIYFIQDYSVPTVSDRMFPITVIYNSGFDLGEESGTGDVPHLHRPLQFDQAILLLAGHWYQNRETVNVGNIVNNLPFAFDAIAHQLRIFR